MSSDERLNSASMTLNRRSFLRGSALLTATFGAALMIPAAFAQDAQEEQRRKEKEEEKDKDKEKENKDSETQGDKAKGDSQAAKEELRDEAGRVYRVCPECGGNMYQQGKTWTCESCGYSYVE